METYIDDVAGDWVADIKGQPVKIPGTNSSSGDVKLPGAFMRASDMRVYYNTLLGHILSVTGLPPKQMKEGIHYYVVRIVPYRPTPENLFSGQKKEKTPHTKTDSRKMYKQAPLRARH